MEELNLKKQDMLFKLEDINKLIQCQKNMHSGQHRGFIPPHVIKQIIENIEKDRNEIFNQLNEIEKQILEHKLKNEPSIVAEIFQSADRKEQFESKYTIDSDCIIKVRRFLSGDGSNITMVTGTHVNLSVTIGNYAIEVWRSVFSEDIFYSIENISGHATNIKDMKLTVSVQPISQLPSVQSVRSKINMHPPLYQMSLQSKIKKYDHIDGFEFEQIDEAFNIHDFKDKLNKYMPTESIIFVMKYLVEYHEREHSKLPSDD